MKTDLTFAQLVANSRKMKVPTTLRMPLGASQRPVPPNMQEDMLGRPLEDFEVKELEVRS